MKTNLPIKNLASLFVVLMISSICFSQNIKDSKWQFKLDIPSSWSKTNYMDGNDKVYDFYSSDQNAAVQLRILTANAQVTYDLLIPLYEENMLSSATRVDLKDITSKNGIPGKQAIYSMNYNGTDVGISIFYTLQNSKAYMFSVMAASSVAENYRNDIESITASFTIDGVGKNPQAKSGLGGLDGMMKKQKDKQQSNSGFGGNSSGGGANINSSSGSANLVYEGQTYRTVKIGNQVWMAENLNVGTMILSSKTQSNNNIVEKYCYDNDKLNCDIKGGLYTWKEMMQYAESDYGDIGHTRGICPQGWHLPTDKEWMVLEGFVDSEYGIGDDIWYSWRTRGKDAAKKLKSKNGWEKTIRILPPDGTDDYGFTVKPVGFKMHGTTGKFFKENSLCIFWTATKTSEKSDRIFYREFSNGSEKAFRDAINQNAYSVRCIKN